MLLRYPNGYPEKKVPVQKIKPYHNHGTNLQIDVKIMSQNIFNRSILSQIL